MACTAGASRPPSIIGDGSRCSLSATPDPRYAHLRLVGWDLAAGKRLKALLCEEEHVKQAYAVCHALCHGRFDSAEFTRFCKAADRRNVWSYRGVTLEIVPYILVTLADLPVNDRVGRKYPLRFVLHKPRDEAIDALWELPGSCRLVPHFADDRGRAMTRCRRPSVPDEVAESKRHDTDWMSPALVRRLRECCFRKRPR